jgi:tRNA pseudouridine38-40 synthase
MNEPAARPGSGLVRLRLDLGYDGTDFSGWARQPGRRTVQGVLTEALGRVLRLDPPPELVVAGRTDAGVHATGQVCHLDVQDGAWTAFGAASAGRRSERQGPADLLRRLAGVLPPDVRVHVVSEAPAGFDARFSALHRRYAYRVCDSPAGVRPLRRRDVLAHRRPLDAAAMAAAAQTLVGLHDFAAFCRRRDGATTIRTLLEYRWSRVVEGDGAQPAEGERERPPEGEPAGRDGAQPAPEGLLVAAVVADAFCHSMVRALVGAVLAVGDGRRPVDWPARVLAAGVRDPGVTVVPPHGLVLEHVAYPAADRLAERARQARAVRTRD